MNTIKIHFKQFVLWNKQKECHTRKGFVPSWNKQTAILLKEDRTIRQHLKLFLIFSPNLFRLERIDLLCEIEHG